MFITICMETIEIKMAELEEKTVRSLIKAIVASRPEGERPAPEDVKVFNKSTRLNPEKTLAEERVEDDTKLFTYIKREIKKKAETKAAQPQQPAQPQGNPFGNFGQPASPGMNEMMKSMLDNPEMIENSINMIMPNASEDQKEMLRKQFEMVKNNPAMMEMAMNQMNNPMMGQMGQMGQMDPMMNQMNQMYPMNNPMNNQMNNPMNNQMNTNAPPANGPCSHGFYPLHVVKAADDLDAKLDMLEAMGFTDKAKNRALLEKHAYSVETVVDELTKEMNKEK
ncbi:hypothetical protein ECANGB1_154 [Enterospora canceri]|uniref:UBA domain-containing protein n=1 Tax=Enterospora canceri TaxID=1081671 RepID=A0A1Y1S8B0_9MICR|nr:hypothetical protein ECANGB1_154 [Enterospora canceri]